MKEAKELLNKLLNNNDTVVVATSGGPDSMCLLHLVKSFKDKKNLTIICAHVNHNVRKESEKEKIFVENYAISNNMIFEYMKIEKYKNNKFSESDARDQRYKFLESIVNKYNAKYLFTAHHGDDLIETILMRIVRGSNLKGYIGIPLISEKDNYKLVRPLLYLNKDDIYKYLDDNKLNYVIDKSNKDNKYTRNRYRNNLLPFLKNEDVSVHLKFNEFSDELIKYYNYVNKIVEKKYKKIVNNNIINIEMLLKEDEFIIDRIIEKYIEIVQKNNKFDISKSQFENIKKLIMNRKNGSINLKNNFNAIVSYNEFYIKENTNIESYKYILKDNIIVENHYKFELLDNCDDKNNYVIRLNKKDIKLPLIIRSKANGDKMLVKNLNGSKKVKDILIDEKIDRLKRKELPIVTDSNNIVIWIPGIKKSIFDKEITEKYDIIIRCTEDNYE